MSPAEKNSADQLYRFLARSRRAEAQARVRDEEHAAQELSSTIANLREERDASRKAQDDVFIRIPSPMPGSNAAGPFVGPMQEGGVGSANPTEHYHISSPPGLKPGPPPPAPPGPPNEDDDNDDDDEDDERRRQKDRKKAKRKGRGEIRQIRTRRMTVMTKALTKMRGLRTSLSSPSSLFQNSVATGGSVFATQLLLLRFSQTLLSGG